MINCNKVDGDKSRHIIKKQYLQTAAKGYQINNYMIVIIYNTYHCKNKTAYNLFLNDIIFINRTENI